MNGFLGNRRLERRCGPGSRVSPRRYPRARFGAAFSSCRLVDRVALRRVLVALRGRFARSWRRHFDRNSLRNARAWSRTRKPKVRYKDVEICEVTEFAWAPIARRSHCDCRHSPQCEIILVDATRFLGGAAAGVRGRVSGTGPLWCQAPTSR